MERIAVFDTINGVPLVANAAAEIGKEFTEFAQALIETTENVAARARVRARLGLAAPAASAASDEDDEDDEDTITPAVAAAPCRPTMTRAVFDKLDVSAQNAFFRNGGKLTA